MADTPARVLVFGATSAIAAEIAALYAGRGARLHLVGRSRDKLAQVAERCRGTRVSTAVADFLRLEDNAALVEAALAELGGCDLVLIAHGDLGDQLETERELEAARATLDLNLTSVISLLIPLVNALESARAGRLGVITSVAGDRGRPRNYTYGTAKGALHIYLQGVRSRLYRSGVGVTTIKLGPVDTPMTIDHDKNAFFISKEVAARAIVRALDGGANEVYVPWFWGLIMPVVKRLPEAIFQRLRFLSGR